MYEEELEIAIKVVIVGNGAVGKSSMIQRYCKGIFSKDYKKTIGVDFLERELEMGGEEIRLMLWDTAGQEEFDAITKAYYRGAQACVLAFSTTDRLSFEAVETWKGKVEAEVGSIPMVLVQNKIDLMHEAKVSEDETDELSSRLRLRLYRTSVKDNYNIEPVFEYLTMTYLENMNNEEEDEIKPVTIGPGLSHKHSTNGQMNVQQGVDNFGFPTAPAIPRYGRTDLNGTINLHSNSHRHFPRTSSGKRKEKCAIL